MEHYKLLITVGIFFLNTSLVFSQENVNTNERDFRITKGKYYSSLTFSLDSRIAKNEDQLIRQVVDQNRYDYRIIGNGGYAIKDNMTLGLLAGYGRAREEITFVDENGENVTSKRLQQGLSLAPNMRNYIPIGKGQLQVLVQTELNVTFGESLQRTFRMDDIEKVEGDFVDLKLGISPGMVLFFDKHWAFETTVGIAGLSMRIEEEITNDDRDNRQRVVESGVDFRINLLQLNLGVAYYF
ncbi:MULTISPECIES: hypothetical protein [unclassified Carboxylicivirga]|uniref:hypothetical protein n=1 Tax=Carboxylicivirga TaxID=1628153 RepID=UPI003D32B1B9